MLVHLLTHATKELSSGVAQTTNNRMELTAIEQGLRAVHKPGQSITVYTDSLLAINWLTGKWKVKDAEIRRPIDAIHELIQYRDAEPDKAYFPVGEEDLNTFFAGATVVCAADGVQWRHHSSALSSRTSKNSQGSRRWSVDCIAHLL